jgi:hypothetical protein
MQHITIGKCTCGKYPRTSEEVVSITTSDASVHCFDGLACLNTRLLVDESVKATGGAA